MISPDIIDLLAEAYGTAASEVGGDPNTRAATKAAAVKAICSGTPPTRLLRSAPDLLAPHLVTLAAAADRELPPGSEIGARGLALATKLSALQALLRQVETHVRRLAVRKKPSGKGKVIPLRRPPKDS